MASHRLGIPYKGSKNSIAKAIIDFLPQADTFVDLFCGGCAVTHQAILSGKYKNFIINDKDKMIVDFFIDLIHGKYKDYVPRWVSHDEFMEKRDIDPIIKYCWSFGNNGRSYAFQKKDEEKKKQLFEKKMNDGVNDKFEPLERIQPLECIEQLERIQSLESIQSFNLDYRFVNIPANSVVYCDIPYNSKLIETYGLGFSFDDFFEWARTRNFPVFVSEYSAPTDFVSIWKKEKYNMINRGGCNVKSMENIFVHERFAEQFKDCMFQLKEVI